MTAAFYVNEDRPTRSATVHQTGGPAMSPSESGRAMGNGTDRFDSRRGALRVARDVGRHVYECQRCNP